MTQENIKLAPTWVRPKRRSAPGNGIKLAFVLPALVIFTAVMIIPILINFLYSFTNWDGFSSEFDFVGLRNFARLLADPTVQRAFLNTLLFTVVNGPLQVGLGLLLALLIQGPGRVRSFFRVVIVLPVAVSGAALGVIGTLVFDPGTGMLHNLATLLGAPWLGANWLGNPSLAMAAVVAMNIWQWTGLTMLIFLAGLSTIPSEMYEAATIDGADRWTRFRAVTWPLLAPAVTINVVLTLIGGLKVFDVIYVLTRGGPGGATESVVMHVAQTTSVGQFGYSAATSLSLTLVLLLTSLLFLAALRRRERVF